ncbi:hypothetical protein Tco_0084854 [Tanacetum coccineum]
MLWTKSTSTFPNRALEETTPLIISCPIVKLSALIGEEPSNEVGVSKLRRLLLLEIWSVVISQLEEKARPKSKNAKVRVNTEESAVKPEPELKNTIECNLYPSDGPGKPNSISMKTVKTKWALNQLQQPICVHLTKTVKTLKTQS